MIFTTLTFAVFLIPVWCAYWLMPRPLRAVFLLAASGAFYLYNQPQFFLLIAGLSVITYAAARMIFSSAGKQRPPKGSGFWWFTGIAVSLAALCYFKYARFLTGCFNDLAAALGCSGRFPLPELVAPLGISFFVFEFIHYLTDVRHGRIKRHSFADFGLFAAFFPTMVSGPIKRFQPFLEQRQRLERFDVVYLIEGLGRMLRGYVQKFVIADSLAPFAELLRDPSNAAQGGLWIALYAYAFKIYFDFAGYSDIAIGTARLFGYRVPENFNWPYLRSNISEFWKSWHMSLSSWIKDYLFIPLGGSRRQLPQTVFNLTLVMALCGLWHGPNYTFIVWGLWHGIGLAVYHAYRQLRAAPAEGGSRVGKIVSVLLTFHFVLIGWVFFAAQNMGDALLIIRRLFS